MVGAIYRGLYGVATANTRMGGDNEDDHDDQGVNVVLVERKRGVNADQNDDDIDDDGDDDQDVDQGDDNGGDDDQDVDHSGGGEGEGEGERGKRDEGAKLQKSPKKTHKHF